MLTLHPMESHTHHACWGGANMWSDASMQASPAPRIHTLPKCDLSMIIMRAGDIVLDRSLWGKMS